MPLFQNSNEKVTTKIDSMRAAERVIHAKSHVMAVHKVREKTVEWRQRV